MAKIDKSQYSKEEWRKIKEQHKLEKITVVPDLPPTSNESKYYLLCLKHGKKYSAEYVNRLYNMVKRNCTLPFEFVCLTEDTTGIDPNIKILQLPAGLKGWWCKPYMYSADLSLNGVVLYMDLDVVISNNIDKLFTWEPKKWCTIRDFTRVMRPQWQKYNSSVVRFNAGELDFIWKEFSRDPIAIQRKYFGDQDYLYDATKNNPATVYPDSWIQSWKWEIRKTKQLDRGPRGARQLTTIENVVPPTDCCVCVFHGDPNPEHCNDPWVVDNWR